MTETKEIYVKYTVIKPNNAPPEYIDRQGWLKAGVLQAEGVEFINFKKHYKINNGENLSLIWENDIEKYVVKLSDSIDTYERYEFASVQQARAKFADLRRYTMYKLKGLNDVKNR